MNSHPTKWENKWFVNRRTGTCEMVRKVEKNGKRYTILMDSENDYCCYLGFDYLNFRKNWIPAKKITFNQKRP